MSFTPWPTSPAKISQADPGTAAAATITNAATTTDSRAFRDADRNLVETDDLMAWSSLYCRYLSLTEE